MTIPRWFLLRMRNVFDKSCRENQTHFIFQNIFQKSCRLWHNVEKHGGARGATNDVTIWCIRVACSTSKATCTHARTRTHTHTQKPVIFIAFP
jgi:hypothetical protein